MTDYRTLFDEKWIKAWDLGGRQITVVIERVKAGVLEDPKRKKTDRKPIVFFRGAKKPLALNKTNAKTIASLYGNDTEKWVGKPITIYPTRTTFGSEEVDCIRVKPSVAGKAEDMPAPPPAPAPEEEVHAEGEAR